MDTAQPDTNLAEGEGPATGAEAPEQTAATTAVIRAALGLDNPADSPATTRDSNGRSLMKRQFRFACALAALAAEVRVVGRGASVGCRRRPWSSSRSGRLVVGALAGFAAFGVWGESAFADVLPGKTTVSLSANPVTLVVGADVVLMTETTAPAHEELIDRGALRLQLATDGVGHPVAAGSVVEWVSLAGRRVRPRPGVASFRLDLDDRGVVPGAAVGLRALYLGGAGAHGVGTHSSDAVDLIIAEPVVVAVEIVPGSVLLTTVGETRKLRARALNGDGAELSASVPVVFSSSDPATVGVASDGTVTANALGSAQLTAEAGGVRSAPVLVVVAQPAAGARLVTDAQIVAGPVASDPAAAPSFENTYRVTLRGVMPAVGDVLLGTGATALAGRVVAVVPARGTTVTATIQLLPLPELLPGLLLDESIDLANAPISFPAQIARNYDIEQKGDRYTFTPKPGAAGPAPGLFESRLAATSARTLALAAPVGTFALPPFADCESSLTGGSGTASPIQFSELPTFTIDVNPSLDILTTANGVERLVARAQPTVKFHAGVKATAVFEGKAGCKMQLFAFTIPIGGPLSYFFGGQVPVGIGFEFAGKITTTTVALGLDVEARADARAGLLCPGGGPCQFDSGIDNFILTTKPTFNAPSLADLRFEPSFQAFGYLKLAVGSSLSPALQWDAFEVKLGGKIAANLAPRVVQILDDSYASDFTATFEASAGIGGGLVELLDALGLNSLVAPELLTKSIPLARSPTGTVLADRTSYLTGDSAHVRVHLDAANLTFFGLYAIDRIFLVRYSGGSQTVIASQSATSPANEINFSFTTTGPLAANELWAFAVPIFANYPELLALEIGKATGLSVTVNPAAVTLAPGAQQQFSATVTGTANTVVAWSVTCGSITTAGLYTAPASGGPCMVKATSSEFTSATGTATVTVNPITVTVTPSSITLAPGGSASFQATVTGTQNHAVTWSTTCGSIDGNGNYTAPATASTCEVKATSAASPTAFGTASVKVQGPIAWGSGYVDISGYASAGFQNIGDCPLKASTATVPANQELSFDCSAPVEEHDGSAQTNSNFSSAVTFSGSAMVVAVDASSTSDASIAPTDTLNGASAYSSARYFLEFTTTQPRHYSIAVPGLEATENAGASVGLWRRGPSGINIMAYNRRVEVGQIFEEGSPSGTLAAGDWVLAVTASSSAYATNVVGGFPPDGPHSSSAGGSISLSVE